MSDAYSVSPAHLLATSAKLRGAAAAIATQLSSCTGDVAGLEGVWTGVSHARYQALYAEWQSSAARLQQALEGIAEMTARAAQVYADGDASVAGMLARV